MSDLKIDMKMQKKYNNLPELCQRKKTCLNKLIKIQIWISLNVYMQIKNPDF